jgi:Ca-activated chloride channel family protein
VKFAHPAWLTGGLLACLYLLWLWRRHDARQFTALARFVSAHLREELTRSVSIARRRVCRGLMLAALALVFVALAGPQLGYRWELTSRRGNEIVFALDTSRSMSTPDVKPDRLTRAKLAIDDFTNRLDGDAIGLVAFAGDAFLVCPITLDYGAFHESLDAVDINTIPRGGTNIASAIREAQSALRRRPGGDKILILATDGEDLEGDALVAAQAAAREDGLKIFTIGVGTPQGDLIPLPSNQGGGFVKDESGNLVKSRLDESALKAIAAATGGLYAPLGAQGQGFETIYDVGLAPMLKHDLASRQQKVYIERYQWPLCASLLLLLASLLIGTRRRFAVRRPSQPAETTRASASSAPAPASAAAPSTAPAPGLTVWMFTVLASAYLMSGRLAYAASTSTDDKPVVQYNRGTAAYRAGRFPEAAKAFQESINHAPSADAQRLADQEDAYYNLGNTLYRSGQKTEASSPEQTLKTWTQAVKAYETALQLRSDDADSKYNRDFVKRKIDELKQNQNPPPPQNSNQGNPPPNQSPNQGQSPPQPNQGNSPPNQPPPQNQPPPGQQPPTQQPPPNQSSGQQPPAQPPPAQPPPAQPPPGAGQPKPAPGTEPPPAGGGGADPSDTERQPGQMSREEARELLDSEKGEERHARGLPYARRDTDSPPDKPIRDW